MPWYVSTNQPSLNDDRHRWNEDGQPELWLTGEDLAEYFGVVPRTIRNYRKNLGLPSQLERGIRRFSLCEVIRWASKWELAE